jgi:hypothetical protein
MKSNNYHFVTRWRIPATPDEVAAILGNGPDLVRWWPSVYLDVRELDAGRSDGVGKVIDLYTRGWLPYTLRWRFRVSEIVPMQRLVLEADGDFVGRGIWSFEPHGQHTLVTYDWKIEARKPLLRYLSFVMKPIFSANHQWAMRMGEQSLLLEIARRRAATPEEAARVPPPPGPARTAALQLILATLALAALAGVVWRAGRAGGS